MKLSPSGSILATIDVSGNISFYDVPSLRLRRQWSIKEQVSNYLFVLTLLACVNQFDALCMKEDVLSGSSTKPSKNGKLGLKACFYDILISELPRPLNISWWSEKVHNYCTVEPLLKDTPNKGYNTFDLSVKD